MLYTKKGDDGTTKIFGCDQRISKSSAVAEALGCLDETNSLLGLCKVQADYLGYKLEETSLSQIIHEMQKTLFIVQAEIAGADKSVDEKKVKELEEIIDSMEKELPPIKSFFISGGAPQMPKWQLGGAGLSAVLDMARTVARRAERRVIAVDEEALQPPLLVSGSEGSKSLRAVNKHTKHYLNRLSSALYALARYASHLAGISEESPDYR
jgi:cob(I)alamin adenosyltransferase